MTNETKRPQDACIKDGCGMLFDVPLLGAAPPDNARAFWYRYCPKHRTHQSLTALAPEMLSALKGLFEQCAMVHKHWGTGSNQKEADAAVKFALEVIAKSEGRI